MMSKTIASYSIVMCVIKKFFKGLNVLFLTFKISPLYSSIYVILTIIKAVTSTLITTLVTAEFVDTATKILQTRESQNSIWKPLIMLLLILLIVNVINTVLSLVKTLLSFCIEKKYKPLIVKMQAEIDFKHLENKDSWELISRVSAKSEESILNGFTAFMTILTIIIYIISVLGLILMQVWWAAVLILVFSAPMLWLSVRTGRKSYQATRETEEFRRRTEYFGDVLIGNNNIEERTLFGYGDKVSNNWWELHEKSRRLRLKVRLRYMVLTKGSTMGLSFIAILVAVTLISPVISRQLSAGMYMALIGTVLGITHQMGWDMSWAVETIVNTEEYLKDFERFQNLSKTSNALSKPDSEPIEFSTLEFCDVKFKYPSSTEYILKGLSFKIERGRHYAFVGGNGVGKTTITKLLTGLYTDYEGSILINGKELRQYSQGAIKALFTAVYQDFSKYYISLKENIALGDVAGNHSDEQFLQIAKSAGLDDVLKDLKNGMETPLGRIQNNGQEISGGQWQRVAIARSLISCSPIKILDEPTSALDPISESQLYYEFEKLMRGKTTIFISHRLSSTKLADEIMVIDNGRIVEQGTHEELMSMNGKYTKMFMAQRKWYQ